MAVSLNTALGAYPITALAGTNYVPLAGGTMTGALTLPAGSVGDPSLRWTGAGSNTGLYSAGANNISCTVNGTRVFYASDLYLWIGTITSLGLLSNSTTLRFGSSSVLDPCFVRAADSTIAIRNTASSAATALHITTLTTDSSNYERLTLTGVAGTSVNITAETLGTGGDNLDIVLTPAGTGNVRTAAPLTIASGTLTASAPALSITQTWNQGATAFTGALIDITNTASSSASRAIDVRIAGASIFAVRPDGYAIASTGMFIGSGGTNGLWDSVGPHVKSTGSYSWAQSANATDTADLFLYRDAAATLAQRNGTTQQTFRLYNSYTDSSNFERLTITGVAGTSVNITAETLGTGGDNIDVVITPAGTGSVKFPGSSSVASDGYSIFTGLRCSTSSSFNYYAAGARNSSVAEIAWTSGNITAGVDAAFLRGAAGQVDVTNGTAATYRDLKLRNLLNTEYHQMTEMTAPAAPATNSVRIYAEDNGAGKTRLMALFATGSAVQLGIEP